MSFVDLDPQPLTASAARPRGFVVTPGADDVNLGSDAPSPKSDWSSTFSWVPPVSALGMVSTALTPVGMAGLVGAAAGSPVTQAAFRQDNTIGAYFAAENPPDYREEGFNPWNAIKGTKYEKRWESFVDVHNTVAADAVMRKIDQEEDDRKTLDAAPWWQSVPAQMVAGILDWPTLLPGGAFVRGAKGGFSIAKSAGVVGAAAGASVGVQELALQGLTETRTAGESAMNIGASVFLGGLLGASGAKLLSDAEWQGAVRALENDLAALDTPRAVPEAMTPGSVGAAANMPTELGMNTIAGAAAGAVAKSTSRLNPLLRGLQSPSAAVREVLTGLVENSIYLKKNMEGVASEAAVETLMKEWNAGLAKALSMTNTAYPEYRKAGGALKRDEFREAVGRAMRRNDQSDDPFVSKVAQAWRADVFDPLKEAAIAAKLLPEDVTVETAASYLSRMWNRNRLIAREGEFKNIVERYYAGAIQNEFESALQSNARHLARLDQEAQDLNLPSAARLSAIDEIERAVVALDDKAGPALRDAADDLAEAMNDMRAAAKAGDDAARAAAKSRANQIREAGGGPLKEYISARSELRVRLKNVDLGAAGLLERSDRILGQLADLEEANHRAMMRLVKRGQKLERDLNRLDADAREEMIEGLANTFADLARKSEAAVERTQKAIERIRAAGERGSARNEEIAQRASTEAITGPPEEAAAKRQAAQAAAQQQRARREAADAKAAQRLQKGATLQAARAERMEKIAQRLKAAVEFDHDGQMAALRDAVEKIVRETSAQSLERGARSARLGERLADLNPDRIKTRLDAIVEMRKEIEQAFSERWEVRNLGQNLGAARPDFSEAARSISEHVFNTLTGKTGEGGVRPEFITVKARGPMKDRTFNIPDELVEDFLESDVEVIGRRYTRVMGADVEMANKFGSVDMKEQIQKIRDDYARLRQGVTDEKQLTKLGKDEEADVRDIEALRDILRGTRHVGEWERNYDKIVRGFNHFNYIRAMGEVVLASLTDAIRPAMVHGLSAYMGGMAQLAGNMKAVKLSVAESQLAGNVAERVLGARLATLSEIVDPYAARGPVERFMENMTNVASKWNGIRIWTDSMKSIASVMTQNRILGNVGRFESIKPKERAYLAYLGIDQSMAERIQAQFVKHGENIDGVRVAKTAAWDDAVAVRAYRAAINKDVDSIIVQKSVADVPLFVYTPTGKALLQFKSFALASHQKVLLRGLQEDQARFVGGLVAMTMMGMFITWMKAVSGNRPETQEKALTNPGWWIGEGLDRAGVFSVPMEMANAFEKFAGVNPIKSPLRGLDPVNNISQKNQNRSKIGSLLGPTAGFVDDATTALGIPSNIYAGEDVTKGQKTALKSVLPFNSYMGVRQMLNYVALPPE